MEGLFEGADGGFQALAVEGVDLGGEVDEFQTGGCHIGAGLRHGGLETLNLGGHGAPVGSLG